MHNLNTTSEQVKQHTSGAQRARSCARMGACTWMCWRTDTPRPHSGQGLHTWRGTVRTRPSESRAETMPTRQRQEEHRLH
eukprot:1867194-Rhodomonas_salina.1